ncbi:MAG TPA: tryptophan--tRNA ligase [Gemmata sp.]|nr:tryptophan--tRNA ligase [Gemmata sp.]
MQSSGKLHIGNYFGAIKQHIDRQHHGDCFYFIADYHALTTLRENVDKALAAAQQMAKGNKVSESAVSEYKAQITRREREDVASQHMRSNIRDAALDYLALGLDPAKVAFYRQSDVPEVCELAWVLSCVTGHGLLERAHSFKDKVTQGITPSVGLFTYPVLMAADILIVRSHQVPVGKDQEQHLEMTRDMARSFNAAYGEVFPLPEAVYNDAAVVPGTDGRKMSKSYGNTINIFAEGKELKNAVMGVVTDSTPVDQPKNPDTCNAFQLLKLFATGDELGKLAELYKNPMLDAESRGGRPFGYGDAKTILLNKIDHYFAAARERRKQLERDPGVVEEALARGARWAREVARVTMRLVRERVGLLSRPV